MKVKNLTEIKRCLLNQKRLLKEYHIEQLGIFGSFVRNEHMNKVILIYWWILEIMKTKWTYFYYTTLKNILLKN